MLTEQGEAGNERRGESGSACAAGVWRHACGSADSHRQMGGNAKRAAATARETKGEVGLNRLLYPGIIELSHCFDTGTLILPLIASG